jgi:hypothetical protein
MTSEIRKMKRKWDERFDFGREKAPNTSSKLLPTLHKNRVELYAWGMTAEWRLIPSFCSRLLP